MSFSYFVFVEASCLQPAVNSNYNGIPRSVVCTTARGVFNLKIIIIFQVVVPGGPDFTLSLLQFFTLSLLVTHLETWRRELLYEKARNARRKI